MITKDMKISKLLAEYPHTLELLVNFSPHFAKLKNKILRKTLASRVNLEQDWNCRGESRSFIK